MFSNRRTRILLILGILVVAIAAAIISYIFVSRSMQPTQTAEQSSIQEKIWQIETKTTQLEQELSNLQQKSDSAMLGDGQFMVVFRDPDATIYTDLFPSMQNENFPGVISLSVDAQLNTEGQLTTAQLQELVNNGWEVCADWDGETPIETWNTSIQRKFSALSLTAPTSVFIPEGSFNASVESTMISLGYTVLLHHKENNTATTLQNNIWLADATPWYEDGANQLPRSVAENGGACIFTIRFTTNTEERFDDTRFQSLLEALARYRDSNQLHITTLQGARTYYLTLQSSEENQAYLVQIQDLQNQISALEQEKEVQKANLTQ